LQTKGHRVCFCLYFIEPETLETGKDDEKSNPTAWWKQFIEGDELENMKYSGKLILLFSILRECEKIGDKV
jgi:transcriptional regulator ATRX